MNSVQIKLVKDSWQALKEKEDLIEDFYTILFRLNPSLQALFKRSHIMQGRKIFSMLDYAIMHLDNMHKFSPPLNATGTRHSDYGVVEEDFKTFGQALIMMLKWYFREQFTTDLEAAWKTAYSIVQNIMVNAMQLKKVV